MLLRATLGAVAPIPSTVVVTHFDLDHWMGLKAFADASPSGSESVQLVQPRFPSRARPVQAALLAYQTLHLTAPERSALDLVQAWENKSADLRRLSAFEGERFYAVGTEWNVLWPPRSLEARVSRVFERVAKESEELAGEYAPLGRALTWANESRFFPEEDRVYEELPNLEGYEEEIPVPDEFQMLDSYGDGNFIDAPAELRDRLRKNRADVQRLNNELSLVVEEVHGRFLSLGDIQGWGINELIRRDIMQDCYDTILAPHHGTQVPGVRTLPHFPWSRLVVAQNGPSHQGNLRVQELNAHTGQVLSTARSGSVTTFGKFHLSGYCRCRTP